MRLPEGWGGLDGGERGSERDPLAGSALGEEGAEADLMEDALTGEGFGQDADDEAQHGGPAVEELRVPQLLFMNLGGGGVLEPAVIGLGGGGGHGENLSWAECNERMRSLDESEQALIFQVIPVFDRVRDRRPAGRVGAPAGIGSAWM